MSTRRWKSGGRSFAGRPTGQQYDAFHSALLSKCYPKTGAASNQGTPVYIRPPQGQRDAGHIRDVGGHSVFVKTVTTSTHLLRSLDAWGLDCQVLDVLKKRDICRIRIIDTESGAIYDTSTMTIDSHGIHRDFGHGAQVFLSRRYWVRGESYRFASTGVWHRGSK